MSVIGILDRIIQRKKQTALSAAEQYHALVRSVANGSEVDCDDAATIIDDANKTAADFERDVEIQQERIGLAAQLRHKHELQNRLPKLEQAERIASENYQRVVSEASERLNAAKKAKRDVELELLGLTQIEGRLRESCLDASLLEREAELNAQRMKLIQQRRPLDEDLSRSAGTVRSHQSSVDALRIKIERAKNDQLARQSYQRDLPQVEQALRQSQHVYDQLQKAVNDIDSELSPVDLELESIRVKKLEV
jgi:uncharacterized protein YukE